MFADLLLNLHKIEHLHVASFNSNSQQGNVVVQMLRGPSINYVTLKGEMEVGLTMTRCDIKGKGGSGYSCGTYKKLLLGIVLYDTQ